MYLRGTRKDTPVSRFTSLCGGRRELYLYTADKEVV
jgi:hypothetical protein